MLLIRYIFLLCFLGCCGTAALASEPSATDGNVHINADFMSQDLATGVYTAEGNVVAEWQGQKLVANKVRYEATTHMLYATGSVVLSKDATVLSGETVVMNIDTGSAEIDPGLLKTLVKSDTTMTIKAEKLTRINEEKYKGTATQVTSCDITDPSWKFGASVLNVNLEGYATGRNIIFYVKNIPVLYLPWMAFPILQEKSSGLLFPRYGHSQKRGTQLDVPLYLLISPSQDLQLDFDIMSRRGLGIGADYRYIRKRGSEGFFSGYHVYDTQEHKSRWQISQQHKEIFSPDANLRMKVDATSDNTFLSDYGDKSSVYNRQSNDTIVNALKAWQDYAVTAHLKYTDNLYTTDNSTTLQTLPSLGVAAVRQNLFSMPVYFDLDSSAENLYRETPPSGQRLHIFPRITILPYKNSILQTELFAGVHMRGYATGDRGSSGVRGSDGDLLPEAGARVSTSLTRVYDTGFSTLKKIRHEIIPELRYNFVPERDQQDLPFYDYTDRMIKRNAGSVSITNLINGKFISGDSTEYRDISRIKIGADYLFSGERRDLLTLVDNQNPWSDLLLETDTWLAKMVRLTFDARYNLYDKEISTVATGIEVDDRQGNSFGAGYQAARNEVEYLEGRLSTKLISPVRLAYTARYSFDSKDFLESVYSAEYRHKCWSVNLAIHQRPGNNSFTINFNLAGLGGIKL